MPKTVDVPAGNYGPVYITITVSAKWPQRVTIKDNQPNGFHKTFNGVGEGKEIANFELPRDQAKSYEVIVEHSEDGGKTFKPNDIKYSEIATKSYPAIVMRTLSTEDGGDKDYDDSIIHFRYTNDLFK